MPATTARQAETVRIKVQLTRTGGFGDKNGFKAEGKEKEKRVTIFSKEKREARVPTTCPYAARTVSKAETVRMEATYLED